MRYPCIKISKSKIFDNAKIIVDKCKEIGIDVWGVTKVCCGDPTIANIMNDAGVVALADSRIRNIVRLNKANLNNLVLLRIAMMSEIDLIIQYVDICLVSEIKILRALNKAANFYKTQQKVMIMIDVGDLREGVYYKRVTQFLSQLPKMNNIEIVGIGTNLTCFGGVVPTVEISQRLIQVAQLFKEVLNIDIKILSGGNSSSLGLVWQNKMPAGINNLRIGEGIMLGRDTVHQGAIENTHNDTFILQAEIIELKYKPSIPDDKTGFDAFGNIPVFKDIGWHYRALLAIGKQDVFPERLVPIDKSLKVLGASSDHLLVSMPNNHVYTVGDTIEFTLDYVGVLNTMTSPYVKKIII